MTRPRGIMQFEDFQKLIDELGAYLFLILFWNQGEPFINKSLLDMVAYSRKKRISTVISTNGHLIRTAKEAQAVIDSGLSELIISLDGATPESFTKYRVGGDFDTVVNAVRLLAEQKRKQKKNVPFIHVQFLVMKHNEHEIPRIKSLVREIGADKFSCKTAQVFSVAEAEKFLPSSGSLRRYEIKEGTLHLKAHFKRGCRYLWFNSMVNWEGSVTPCCFDKDAEYTFGNVFNGEAFAEIWTSRLYYKFRRNVLRRRERVAMCRNCVEGLKIRQFHTMEWVAVNRSVSRRV
jgi:radical SAM protein with 4Fe4S-binding SPASM domain